MYGRYLHVIPSYDLTRDGARTALFLTLRSFCTRTYGRPSKVLDGANATIVSYGNSLIASIHPPTTITALPCVRSGSTTASPSEQSTFLLSSSGEAIFISRQEVFSVIEIRSARPRLLAGSLLRPQHIRSLYYNIHHHDHIGDLGSWTNG